MDNKKYDLRVFFANKHIEKFDSAREVEFDKTCNYLKFIDDKTNEEFHITGMVGFSKINSALKNIS